MAVRRTGQFCNINASSFPRKQKSGGDEQVPLDRSIPAGTAEVRGYRECLPGGLRLTPLAAVGPAIEGFQVLGFGDGRVYRMIRPLPAPLKNLQPPPDLTRLPQQDALQLLLT